MVVVEAEVGLEVWIMTEIVSVVVASEAVMERAMVPKESGTNIDSNIDISICTTTINALGLA